MLYLRSAVRAYALKYGISEDEVASQLRAKQPDARFESETAPAIQEPEPMEPIASDPLSTPTPRTSLKTPTTAETAPSMGAESSPVKNTDYMGGIGRAASGIASDPMAFADEVTTGLGDGLVEGSKQVYKSMLQSTKATEALKRSIDKDGAYDSSNLDVPENIKKRADEETPPNWASKQINAIGTPDRGNDPPLVQALAENSEVLDDPRFVAKWVRNAITDQIPIMGSIMAVSAINPMLGLYQGMMMETGGNYESMLEQDVKTGKATEAEAALAAVVGGVLSGGLEARLPTKWTKRVRDSVFKEAKDIAADASKKGFLKKAGGVVGDAGLEGLTEYVQTSIGTAARAIYDKHQSVLEAFYPTYENLEAALMGAFIGGTATTVGKGISAGVDAVSKNVEGRIDAEVDAEVVDEDVLPDETKILSDEEVAAQQQEAGTTDGDLGDAPAVPETDIKKLQLQLSSIPNSREGFSTEEKEAIVEAAGFSIDSYDQIIKSVVEENQIVKKEAEDARIAAKGAAPDMSESAVQQRVAEGAQRVARREAGSNAATGDPSTQTPIDTIKGAVDDYKATTAPKKAIKPAYVAGVVPDPAKPKVFRNAMLADLREATDHEGIDDIEDAIDQFDEDGQLDNKGLRRSQKNIESAIAERRAELDAEVEQKREASETERTEREKVSEQGGLFGEMEQKQKARFQPENSEDAGALGYTTDVDDKYVGRVTGKPERPKKPTPKDRTHKFGGNFSGGVYAEDYARFDEREADINKVLDWAKGPDARMLADSDKEVIQEGYSHLRAKMSGDFRNMLKPDEALIEAAIEMTDDHDGGAEAEIMRKWSRIADEEVTPAEDRLNELNKEELEAYEADDKTWLAERDGEGNIKRNMDKAPLFQSTVYPVLMDKMGKKPMKTDMIMSLIRSQKGAFLDGVKKEEVDDLRLEAWLSEQGETVRKEDVLAYIDGELKGRLRIDEETYGFTRGEDAEGSGKSKWVVYAEENDDSPDVYDTEEEAISERDRMNEYNVDSYIENYDGYHTVEAQDVEEPSYVKEDRGAWSIFDGNDEMVDSGYASEQEAEDAREGMENRGELTSTQWAILGEYGTGNDVVDTFSTEDEATARLDEMIEGDARQSVQENGAYIDESDDPDVIGHDNDDDGNLGEHYAGATRGGTGYGTDIGDNLKEYGVAKMKQKAVTEEGRAAGKRGGDTGTVHWQDAHQHARWIKEETENDESAFSLQEIQADTAQEGGKTRGEMVSKLIKLRRLGKNLLAERNTRQNTEDKQTAESNFLQTMEFFYLTDDVDAREFNPESKDTSKQDAKNEESRLKIVAKRKEIDAVDEAVDLKAIRKEVEPLVDPLWAYQTKEERNDSDATAEVNSEYNRRHNELKARQAELVSSKEYDVDITLAIRELGLQSMVGSGVGRYYPVIDEARKIYHKETLLGTERSLERAADAESLAWRLAELNQVDALLENNYSGPSLDFKEQLTDAPRKRSWLEFGLKRMLDQAVKGDYKFFTFPRTKEQVEEIENWGETHGEKDVMIKRMTEEAPRFLKKYLKQLDPDLILGTVTMKDGEVLSGFPITPKLREAIMEHGQKMYQGQKSRFKAVGKAKLTKTQRERVEEIANAVGYDGEILSTKKHMKVRFGPVIRVMPSTPSEGRGQKNAINETKQAIRVALAKETAQFAGDKETVQSGDDIPSRTKQSPAKSTTGRLQPSNDGSSSQVYTAFKNAQNVNGHVALHGEVIVDTQSMAEASQILRDPRHEHMRFAIVDSDTGESLAVESYTSRDPSSVDADILGAGLPVDPTADQIRNVHAKNAYKLADRLERTAKRSSKGNVSVYLLHNHPDGDSSPSAADVQNTPLLARIFKERGVEYKGHVVINSSEYSVVHEDGSTLYDLATGEKIGAFDVEGKLIEGDAEVIAQRRNDSRDYDPVLSDMARPVEQRQITVDGTIAVAKIGVDLKTPQDYVTMIALDAENRMTAARQVHKNEMGTDSLNKMLDNWASETGAREMVAYYGGDDAATLQQAQELLDANSAVDLIFDTADGPRSLRQTTGTQEAEGEVAYGRELRKNKREFRMEQETKAKALYEKSLARIVVANDRRFSKSTSDQIKKGKDQWTLSNLKKPPTKWPTLAAESPMAKSYPKAGIGPVDQEAIDYRNSLRNEDPMDLGTILNNQNPFLPKQKIEYYKGSLFLVDVTDPSIAGGEILDSRGIPLGEPVRRYGGPMWPANNRLINPHMDPVAWGNTYPKGERLQARVNKLSKELGIDDIYITPLMMPNSIDFQLGMLQGLIRQFPALKMSDANIKLLDNQILANIQKEWDEKVAAAKKAGKRPPKGSPAEFNGILNEDSVLLDVKTDTALRRTILWTIHDFRDSGAPLYRDMARVMADPEYYYSNFGDIGAAVSPADTDGSAILNTDLHTNFTNAVRATKKGASRLEELVPVEIAFPKRFAEQGERRNVKGNPMTRFEKVGAMYMGNDGSEIVDDQVIDSVNSFNEMRRRDREDILEIAAFQQAQKTRFNAEAVEKNNVGATDLGQVSATFKSPKLTWEKGSRVVDLGGGKSNIGTEYMREKGAEVIVIDPFQRSDEHNAEARAEVNKKQGDYGTLNSVLNVIESPELRLKALRDLAGLVKQGGGIRIKIYEGDGKGVGRQTKTKSWQNNRKLASYLPEVQSVFPDAITKGGFIVATNTTAPIQMQQGRPEMQQPQKQRFNMEDPQRAKNFQKFWKESKVVDIDGEPLVVYSGTLRNYDTYDPNIGNKDNYSGRGFYATDSKRDASENYANINGPDPANRLMLAKEVEYDRLLNEDGIDVWNDPALMVRVDQRLEREAGDHQGVVMPVYLSIQNPLVLSLDAKKGWLNYDQEVDPAVADEIRQVVMSEMSGEPMDAIQEEIDERLMTEQYDVEPSGSLMELTDAMWDAALDYEVESTWGDRQEFNEQALGALTAEDYGGRSANDMFKEINEWQGGDLIDVNGESVGWGQVLREAAEKLGYDGIIVDTNTTHFGHMPDVGERHYVAFRPNQIKSALGNDGNFSESDNMMEQSQKARFNAQADNVKLFHGGPNRIAKQDIFNDPIEPMKFGLFTSQDKEAAASHIMGKGQISEFDIPENKIASSSDLGNIAASKVESHLSKRFPDATSDELDEIYDVLIGESDSEVLEEVFDRHGMLMEGHSGEVDWIAQRERGRLAWEMGFDAVEMGDEHGTSILLLPERSVGALGSAAMIPVGDPRRDENLKAFHRETTVKDIQHHGSPYSFDVFQPSDYGDLGFHVGTPIQANQFARKGRSDGGNMQGNVMPVYIRLENPVRMRDMSSFSADRFVEHFKQNDPSMLDRLPDDFHMRRNDGVIEALKGVGFDGVTYLNRHEGLRVAKDISIPREGFGKDPINLTKGDEISAMTALSLLWRVYPEVEGSGGNFAQARDFTDEQFTEYIASSNSHILFDKNQIKSATGNSGQYSDADSIIRQAQKKRFSDRRIARNVAIQTKEGEVIEGTQGDTHPSQLEELFYESKGESWMDADGPYASAEFEAWYDKTIASEGFVTPDGQYIDRAEAGRRVGGDAESHEMRSLGELEQAQKKRFSDEPFDLKSFVRDTLAAKRAATEPDPVATMGVDEKERSAPESLKKAGHYVGDNLYYTPITNAEDSEAAMEAVISDPDGVLADVMDRGRQDITTEDAPTHTAQGVALLAYYEGKAIEADRASDTELAHRLRSRAITVAGEVSAHLTKSGQEVQAAKLMTRLSPESLLITAQRIVTRMNEDRTASAKKKDPTGKTISTEEYRNISQLAKDAQAWNDLGVDIRGMTKTLKKLTTDGELNQTDHKQIKSIADNISSFLGSPLDAPAKKGEKKKSALRTIMDVRVDAMESRAKAYLADKGIRIGAGIPVDMMAAYAGLGAAKIYRGTTTFSDWVTEMKAAIPENEFGNKEWRKIYGEAWSLHRKEQKRGRRMAAKAKSVSDLINKVLINPDVAEMQQFGSFTNYEALAAAAKELKEMHGEVQMEAAQEVALAIRQLDKPDLAQRLSTVQAISHLMNPVTMGRNIVGNELHWRFDRLAKYVATPIDYAASKLTGSDRHFTFRGNDQGRYWHNFIVGAKVAWNGGNPAGLETQFSLHTPAFNGKWNPMTYVEKSMGVALRGFDYAAYKRAYNVSLAEMAHVAYDKGGQVGDRNTFVAAWMAGADENAMEFADQFGKRITFQDDSVLAQGAVRLKREMNRVSFIPNRKADPVTGEKAFGVGDLILKYPKTPSNLFDRAIDYSPLGFIRAGVQMTTLMGKDQPTADQWGMTLARAFVGSGLSAMAALLFEMGVLTGGDEDDWDANSLMREQTGVTKYQINTSALIRFFVEKLDPKALKRQDGDSLINYNWALPMSVPMAMGADFMRGYNEQVKLDNVSDALGGAIGSTFDAFAEMPTLQSLGRLFQQKDRSDELPETLVKNLWGELEGLPSQFVPTFVYQIRKTYDNERRYTTGESEYVSEYLPSPAHRAMNKIIYRLPFVSKSLPAQYKTLGIDMPKEQYQNGSNNLFNVFFNPAFLTKYEASEDVAAIMAPYESELWTKQFPRSVGRKYRVGGVSIELTAEDRSEMQRRLAQQATLNIKAILRAGGLRGKTPEEQADIFVKGVSKTRRRKKIGGLTEAGKDVKEWFIRERLKDYTQHMNSRQLKSIEKYL